MIIGILGLALALVVGLGSAILPGDNLTWKDCQQTDKGIICHVEVDS